ncbi:hypothetical protein BGZ60DRAFT_411197 [Tricladium varicosporioides]|nr:hypothetical protein BGZ60DRAFT_411197 [Hymenoscyphus varicosporioides]
MATDTTNITKDTTTDNYSHTLLSLLCSNRWRWDSAGYSAIIFNADHTGELKCASDSSYFIGAKFEWKAKDPNTRCWQATTTDTTQLQCQFVIEITLQKQGVGSPSGTAQTDPAYTFLPHLQTTHLNDEAFLPKIFTIRLEKGRFATQCDRLYGGKTWYGANRLDPWATWFSFKLVFDPSPYPPRKEWKDFQAGSFPEGTHFWEWNEFYSVENEDEVSDGVVGAIKRSIGLS